MCRILLADSYQPFREGLRRIIDEQPDLEIAGETGECPGLFDLMRNSTERPLLVLLDVGLPPVPWTQTIRKIGTDHPGAKVLVLSMHEDVEYLKAALANGAKGYLIKESADKELLPAIKTIRDGSIYIPPVLAGMLPGYPIGGSP